MPFDEVFTFTKKPHTNQTKTKDKKGYKVTNDDADTSESLWQPNFTSQINGFTEDSNYYDDNSVYDYYDYYDYIRRENMQNIKPDSKNVLPYDTFNAQIPNENKSKNKKNKVNKKKVKNQNTNQNIMSSYGYGNPEQQMYNWKAANDVTGLYGHNLNQDYQTAGQGVSRWDQGYGSYGGGRHGYGQNSVNIHFQPNLKFQVPQNQNYQILESLSVRVPGLGFPTDLGICPDIILAAVIAAAAVAAALIYSAIVAAGRKKRKRRSSLGDFYLLVDAALKALTLGMETLIKSSYNIFTQTKSIKNDKLKRFKFWMPSLFGI